MTFYQALSHRATRAARLLQHPEQSLVRCRQSSPDSVYECSVLASIRMILRMLFAQSLAPGAGPVNPTAARVYDVRPTDAVLVSFSFSLRLRFGHRKD
jgi:hypothetical protein